MKVALFYSDSNIGKNLIELSKVRNKKISFTEFTRDQVCNLTTKEIIELTDIKFDLVIIAKDFDSYFKDNFNYDLNEEEYEVIRQICFHFKSEDVKCLLTYSGSMFNFDFIEAGIDYFHARNPDLQNKNKWLYDKISSNQFDIGFQYSKEKDKFKFISDKYDNSFLLLSDWLYPLYASNYSIESFIFDSSGFIPTNQLHVLKTQLNSYCQFIYDTAIGIIQKVITERNLLKDKFLFYTDEYKESNLLNTQNITNIQTNIPGYKIEPSYDFVSSYLSQAIHYPAYFTEIEKEETIAPSATYTLFQEIPKFGYHTFYDYFVYDLS